MTRFPYAVQCDYAAYCAVNLTVEDATSLEDACARAIVEANSLDGWKSIDHCEPAFVDAIAPVTCKARGA